ncbi:RagB/SusD family nutrient uptake outer membrane protein [Chitinophaga parva]|uniref:RagB/SusD family nutrient uptake outer membrane protein n=1 Tax=Chitinophaga parva TaxID=2169414 RepID=A0A2T7BHS9_9BACT|nr:RagB/SusD family nutrient uptake outer membrane protein [Chitinophaga parva]PUZ25828.1 RagB/SusD family nutrient uptake outer membrane protein [Chitinophaga parva]
MKSKYLLLSAALLLSGTSCKKYLEQAPDQRTQLNTVQKVAEILGTAYTQADYATFTEAASDNAEDKGINVGTLDPMNQDAYNWTDVRSRDGGSPTGFWNASYAAIAAANAALDAIAKAADPKPYQPYKGEALVARAYAHFMLAILYATPYEPGGKNTAPGIPYVVTPEKVVFQKYDRGTVQETYDKIEKDLLEGLPLLRNSAYAVPKYHFNTAAAYAFAARFYLFKHEYDKVVEYATAAFPGNSFASNIRPWNTTYYNASANEMQIMFTQASQNSNLLLTEAPSIWARNNSFYRYGMGYYLNDELSTQMVTGTNFSGEKMYSYGGANFTLLKWNELFVRSSPNANIGIPYAMMIQFTADELLMNRAEAYANLGQNDLALADINTFASTRIRNYNPATHGVTLAKIEDFYGISDPKQGLVQTILDFKKREFIQEGLRWLDIIRLKLPVVHNVKAQNNSDTYVTLQPDDPRRLFQLPEEVALSNVPLNPR